MAAVNSIKTKSFGNDKQILIAPELAFTIGCLVTNTGVSADAEGKKVLKAGTPVGASANVLETRTTVLAKATESGEDNAKVSNAQGVLLHDVDVTAGQANATLVVEGIIDKEKLETSVATLYTNAAKTAMPKITLVSGSKV